MAEGALAAYKKTPEEPVEAWSLWMRAALCSSRWFGVPGPLAGKRRSCANGIGVTGSRPSAQSPWHLVDGGLAFIGLSIPITSATQKCLDSFRGSGDICRRDLRSSGTGGSPIGQSRSKRGLESVTGSWSSGCPLTLRISTPWKWFGAIPSMGSLPTTHQRALTSLNKRLSTPCSERKVRDRCSWPSSKALDWNCDMFHYLGKSQ
jgi:hypothetical protein